MLCQVHDKEMVCLGERYVCAACLAAGSAGASEMMKNLRARMADSDFHRRIREAGIPTGFEGAGFGNFVAATPRARQVADVLSGYCANFESQRNVRSGFLFTGSPGTGKTHLGCAMVHALVEAGFHAVYASLPRFTSELRAGFGRQGVAEGLVASLSNADLLVLDEIDLHGTSDHDYNTLYDIVNARYERNGHPTLAISNRTAERLTNDLDERLVSRILAGSKAIVFDWPSRRELRISQRRISNNQTDNTKAAL